jgi:quercetin dioxygenase-like cupin family protein
MDKDSWKCKDTKRYPKPSAGNSCPQRFDNVFRHSLILTLLGCSFSCAQVYAQGVAVKGDPCKPVSQRTQDVGCWILADHPIGRAMNAEVFWHLDAYPTRAEAEADKGPRGIVFESLGKVWLMTIEDETWRPAHGNRIAQIGPLPVTSGEEYSTQFMEAVFTPGMTAPGHIHSGAEAFFMVAGETCLETSDGRVQVGRPGGPALIVPAGLAMHLTATGTVERRALVLILHDSSRPPTTMVHDWTPKGLCKGK